MFPFIEYLFLYTLPKCCLFRRRVIIKCIFTKHNTLWDLNGEGEYIIKAMLVVGNTNLFSDVKHKASISQVFVISGNDSWLNVG